jgi:transposase
MPAPLSMDLRRRIVAAYEGGGSSQEEVARRFDVGVATVVRLWAKHRRRESLAASPIPGLAPSVVTHENAAVLAELVAEEADLPQWLYAERLSERLKRPVSAASVGRLLRKLGYTRKKKR